MKELYITCPVDGIQTDITPRDWGDEVAEMMGERMVTAECPICRSTLSVKERETKKTIIPQTKTNHQRRKENENTR